MNNETIKKQAPEFSDKEREESKNVNSKPYDAIVIGAGICGTIFLAYAVEKGLRCIALEKQSDVGGLWNRLPSWQDLQNRRLDISINGIPLEGVDQPAVHKYVREWVRRFDLDQHIRLNCEVSGVFFTDGVWTVHTKQEDIFRTDNVIVASGAQDEPWIPDVERIDSLISENHSFDLQRPGSLKDQRITVVGGGASSQDLLELAINHGAKEVHWIHRNDVKWFQPTRKEKHHAWPNLRELSLGQCLNGTRAASALMRQLLKFRYNRFGLSELIPDDPFDFDKHQLIPGRASLIRNFNDINRHNAEIRNINGREIILTNGEHFETDRVLWGTGYRMNLRYLGLPEYSHINSLTELIPKLGSLSRSLDYPNLFFLGMPLINTSSSTPFIAAVESKTIISHIQGECEIPEKILPHHLTHWDLIRYFATFDRANYPRWWKLKYLWLSLWYEVMQNRAVRVGI